MSFTIGLDGSYDSLPIEKVVPLHNLIIHIKKVLNEYQNHYYRHTFSLKMFVSIS